MPHKIVIDSYEEVEGVRTLKMHLHPDGEPVNLHTINMDVTNLPAPEVEKRILDILKTHGTEDATAPVLQKWAKEHKEFVLTTAQTKAAVKAAEAKA